MNNHDPNRPFQHRAPRRGVTLREVLVSTLIMSIGVVSLATLFPISVLRSIQASQLTNAANLRYNAEAQARAIPQLITIGNEWEPLAPYAVGDTVIPSENYRRKYPATVHVCTQAGNTQSLEPGWSFRERGTTTEATGVEWQTVRLRHYIVDPLGYMLIDPTDANGNFRGAVAGARQHFGNVGGTPFDQFVNRFPAFGLFLPGDTPDNNEFRAASAAVLPDSWTLQAESKEVVGLSATSLLMGGVNFAELSSSVTIPTPPPDLVPDRLVVYDTLGRRSHTLSITGLTADPNGTIVNTGESLPTGFDLAMARVESLERRYTYFLSVRRGAGGQTFIDCVVVFRRSYSELDEQVYSALFRRVDRGLNGTLELTDAKRNFVIVQYNSTRAANDGWQPFFKRGSFICDAKNLRWYRILDVVEGTSMAAVTPVGFEQDPVAPGNDRFVRLTVDREIVVDSLGTTTIGGIDYYGGAVLMRGVVDVFPLKPRTY